MEGSRVCATFQLLLVGVQITLSSQTEQLQLLLASVVFRHGDRSPVDAYPTDEHQESYWPQGFGQLSTVGMGQQLFLGSLLRERYVGGGLITSNYTRVQVYVRSTDYDRTLMSAEAQLAGLFPPEGDQVFNTSVPWQPIPVHTVPKDQDNLLRAYSLDCPRYKELRKQDQHSAEYKQLENENKEFLKRMGRNTGLIPSNLSNMWTIQDILQVQSLNNISMPPWLEPGDWEKLTELATYTLNLMFSSTEKSRLVGGNWVGKVVRDMNTRVSDPENDMRLYLYSAHDTTVAAMATALGVYNHIMPPYASAIMIELYSDTNGNHWVSLFYRNETNRTHLWPLNVSSCLNTTLCTLQEFIDHTAPVIPDDWEKECGKTNTTASHHTADVAIGAVLGGAVVILLILCVVLVMALLARRRRSKKLDAFIRMEESEDENL